MACPVPYVSEFVRAHVGCRAMLVSEILCPSLRTAGAVGIPFGKSPEEQIE